MIFVEGNLPTGHKTTVRSGRPAGPEMQVTTDTCGMLEAYAEVDKSLADLNGNTVDFRLSEDLAYIEAMNNACAETLFYGDTGKDPEKFLGLAPRYNSLTATVHNSENVIDALGGTAANNTSIWLITWGPNTCHGIFPKGQTAGLQHTDLGEVTIQDSQTPAGNFQGYRSHYKWDIGLCLRDWRYVVRIANIDTTALKKDAASGADVIELMVKAIHKLPSMGMMGNMVFYCNSTIHTYLDLQTLYRKNNALTYGPDVHGREVLKFRGIPVKRCDAIAIGGTDKELHVEA